MANPIFSMFRWETEARGRKVLLPMATQPSAPEREPESPGLLTPALACLLHRGGRSRPPGAKPTGPSSHTCLLHFNLGLGQEKLAVKVTLLLLPLSFQVSHLLLQVRQLLAQLSDLGSEAEGGGA